MRKVMDAVDLTTNEKIYFKGHAKATYLSDGRNVEDAINEIPSGESSVFEAIYGTTTYEEIIEANNAGKEVVCNYSNWFARLARIQESRVILQAFSEGIVMILFCSNKNEWSLVWRYTDHKLETVDDDIVKITIANVSEEIATPEYVSNAITTAITNELNSNF